MATTNGGACPAVRQEHPPADNLQQHFGLTAAAATAAAAAWNLQHQQHQQHSLHHGYSSHHQEHHHHLQHHQHQHHQPQQTQQHHHQSQPSCWYTGNSLDFGQQAAAAAVFGFHCYSTAAEAPTQPPPHLAQQQQQQQVHQSSPMHGGGSSPSGIQWLEEARAISQTLSQETIRDLEQFAEAFKQRRVKLGFTQADVGRDIAQLNVAGMGSLSQSTICRFESLTLSHNNMLALRPILEQWLVHAERQYQSRLCSGLREAKRRRTSIATPERRSLEAYFAVQSRPSSDKIGDIAQKLGLKKSVVRVWFCNQRQKQKRIKIGNCQADQAPPTPTCRRLPLPPGEAEDFEVGTDEDSGQTLDM